DLLSCQEIIAHHIQQTFFNFHLVIMLDTFQVPAERHCVRSGQKVFSEIRKRLGRNGLQIEVGQSPDAGRTEEILFFRYRILSYRAEATARVEKNTCKEDSKSKVNSFHANLCRT